MATNNLQIYVILLITFQYKEFEALPLNLTNINHRCSIHLVAYGNWEAASGIIISNQNFEQTWTITTKLNSKNYTSAWTIPDLDGSEQELIQSNCDVFILVEPNLNNPDHYYDEFEVYGGTETHRFLVVTTNPGGLSKIAIYDAQIYFIVINATGNIVDKIMVCNECSQVDLHIPFGVKTFDFFTNELFTLWKHWHQNLNLDQRLVFDHEENEDREHEFYKCNIFFHTNWYEAKIKEIPFCTSEHQLVANLETRFNFTPILYRTWLSPYLQWKHHQNKIFLKTASLTITMHTRVHYFFQVGQTRLMYCVQKDSHGVVERDWVVWILPYDTWSWILIPVSYIVFTSIIYAKRKKFGQIGKKFIF